MALTIPTFSDTEIPSDAEPDAAPETTHEYSCEVCGKELAYGGRGRKPRFCDEHKSRSTSARKTSLGKNDILASQATEALAQFNGIIAIGVMMLGLPLTAQTLSAANDGFREQARSALLTDPELCKMILKGGTGSGKVALAVAYGMLGSAVVPVAITEVKARRKEAGEKAE